MGAGAPAGSAPARGLVRQSARWRSVLFVPSQILCFVCVVCVFVCVYVFIFTCWCLVLAWWCCVAGDFLFLLIGVRDE